MHKKCSEAWAKNLFAKTKKKDASFSKIDTDNQKNMFGFQGAVANLDRLEQILTDAVSVVKMIDDLGEFGEKITSTTLGKALGSRVTARCYLSYEKPEELALARKDSDAALEQFQSEADKARQYMTRSMVECLDGRFEDALIWLGRAYRREDSAPAKLLAEFRRDKNSSAFGILHYTTLMALALKKDHPLGRELFSAWNMVPLEDIIPDSREHPTNIILWRIAISKAIMQPGAATAYYKEAISATDSNPRNLPHFMARLAMKADYEGMSNLPNKSKSRRSFLSFERDYLKMKECWPGFSMKVLSRLEGYFAYAKNPGNTDGGMHDPANIANSIPIL